MKYDETNQLIQGREGEKERIEGAIQQLLNDLNA